MKTLNELCAEIFNRIEEAEACAKLYKGYYYSVVLRPNGSVCLDVHRESERNNDDGIALFVAYSNPKGVHKNDIGIDKDYKKTFWKNSYVTDTGIILSDGKTDYCIAHYVNAEKNIDRYECEIV